MIWFSVGCENRTLFGATPVPGAPGGVWGGDPEALNWDTTPAVFGVRVSVVVGRAPSGLG